MMMNNLSLVRKWIREVNRLPCYSSWSITYRNLNIQVDVIFSSKNKEDFPAIPENIIRFLDSSESSTNSCAQKKSALRAALRSQENREWEKHMPCYDVHELRHTFLVDLSVPMD